MKEDICVFCEIDWKKLNKYLFERDGYIGVGDRVEHPLCEILKKNSSLETFFEVFGGETVDVLLKTSAVKKRKYLKQKLLNMFYENQDELDENEKRKFLSDIRLL